uniref:EGF-like domain-containing protein n=1 Tax=Sinocyclocheilus grahami TaxID=75366 RepID=A0A672QQI3_SINGR
MRNLAIIALLLSCVINGTVYSQVTCRRATSREWHTQPKNISVKWTLMENTCSSLTQCWNRQTETNGRLWTTGPYDFPQLCPLEFQLGDVMFVSADRTLELYGIHLINVSKEVFENCLTLEPRKEQLVFANSISTLQVESKWLMSGMNYFTVVHRGSSHLCRLGLRIALLVKPQYCQSSPLLHLCSGNGECRTTFKDDSFSCQCHKHFSGRYCENIDGCYEHAPCANGATCIDLVAGYECLCAPGFKGKNIDECSSNPCSWESLVLLIVMILASLKFLNRFCLTILLRLRFSRFVVYLFLPHFFLPLNFLLTCLDTALCEQPASLAMNVCGLPSL